MTDTPREVMIWQIIEHDLPDTIGITAREYANVGWQYKTGMNVGTRNRELAIKCFERAVKMGHDKAMMSLAELYHEDGDMEQYYRWLHEAAFLGEIPEAFYELGELYFEGEYVRKDLKKAYKYFELSSKNGADGSKYYIGYYAENGLLGEPDIDRAILYYIGGAKEYDERCWERLDALHVDYEL